MTTNRLEAFSDGVLAIIITIMVLEMKVPIGSSFKALQPMIPIFLTYVGSFIYLGIYWNNHHHLMQATKKVNGKILWANLHLLFWLSLFPFVTAWMGENHFEKHPVILYGLVLLMAGVAYEILVLTIIKHEGKESTLAQAIGKDSTGFYSVFAYAIAMIISFFQPIISVIIYILIGVIWIIPEKRIEKFLNNN